MQNQPFDLSKLDTRATQKTARKKLLKRSIIPTAFVALVALWFLLPSVLTAVSISKYANNSFKGARSWLVPLTWTSPERYIVEYNTGTVDTKLEKYDKAETELNRALALAPDEAKCMVAKNLVYSHNAHAKSLEANIGQANIYKAKAKDVMKANQDCFQGASGGSSGGGASSSAAAENALTDTQQKDLQQKEQEGNERKAKFARDETYNPDDPQTKPW